MKTQKSAELGYVGEFKVKHKDGSTTTFKAKTKGVAKASEKPDPKMPEVSDGGI